MCVWGVIECVEMGPIRCGMGSEVILQWPQAVVKGVQFGASHIS